jgi:hypothetical protein
MTRALDIAFAFSPSDEGPVGRLSPDGTGTGFEYDNAFASSRLSLNIRR